MVADTTKPSTAFPCVASLSSTASGGVTLNVLFTEVVLKWILLAKVTSSEVDACVGESTLALRDDCNGNVADVDGVR